MQLASFLYALGTAAALVALAWRPWRGGAAPRTGPLLTAFAVPLAFIAAWYGWNEAWPALLPEEQSSAKLWVLPGLLLGALGSLGPRCLPLQVFLAWVAAEVIVGAGHALALSRVEGELLPLVLAMKAGLVLTAVSLAAAAPRPGFEPALLALVGLVGAALTVMNGGWAQGAVLLAAVGFVSGGALVTGIWRRDWAPLAGSGLVVGLAGGAVLLVGYRLAEAPLVSTLLAAAAPLSVWIPGKGRALTCLRLAIAVGLAYGAYHLSVPPPNPYADYGGSW